MTETRSLRTFRIVLWSLVVVAAIAATALFFLRPSAVNGPGGGQFALVDQRGAPVDQTIFEGHPSLLFFGYTHCPDVCPTTMGEMQGWFAALGDEAKALKGVFITVDPARDTPEILDGYVSWVSDRVVALTGPQAEIDKVVKDWNATAEKVPGEGEDYTMSHTASVFLVDSKGQFVGTIGYGENTDTALEKIRRLIANNPSA
jgi:protein SCO1/2